MYHVRVLSNANVVECEEDVTAEDLIPTVQQYIEDFSDLYPGYTIEITAIN